VTFVVASELSFATGTVTNNGGGRAMAAAVACNTKSNARINTEICFISKILFTGTVGHWTCNSDHQASESSQQHVDEHL
jgi:hypothetical protein